MLRIKQDSFLQPMPQNILASVPQPFVNGTLKALLNLTESMDHLLGIDESIFCLLLEQLKNQPTPLNLTQLKVKPHKIILSSQKEQFIVELVHHIKKMTCKDKLILYNNYIHNLKFLRILEAVSISNDTTFSSLSKNLLQVISSKLWLPTKTDFQDSVLSSSNGSCCNTAPNSWFLTNKITNQLNKNLQTTYFQSCMSSLVDKTEKENMEQPKTKKPTQKKILLTEPVKIKIACDFIVTKKIEDTVYGKHCNNLCSDNNTKCDEHLNKPLNIYNCMANNTCTHVITQQSRGLDRKGMVCCDFTFGSTDVNYCKNHAMRHKKQEDENAETVFRTFKVRFYPDKQQRIKLGNYFGCARYTYNLCVEHNEIDKNAIELRNIYVTNENLKNTHNFLKSTPKEIRFFAIKEYTTNRDNAKKSYKKAVDREIWKRQNYKNYVHKTINKPVLTYKTKKEDQCITVAKDATKIKDKKIFMYTKIFSENNFKLIKRSKKDKKLNELLNDVLRHDIKIIKTTTDKYYLCFAEDVKKKEINEKTMNNNVCAIDPGVRTFATVYSENEIIEIGTEMNKKLGKKIIEKNEKHRKYKEEIKRKKETIHKKNHHQNIFHTNEKHKKETEKIMFNYNKAKNEYYKVNEKIKNMIDDMHYKTITKLANFSSIYIPILNSKQLMEGPTLNGSVKQLLQAERHGKFISRLKEKCEIKGIHLETPNERLTTKTCSRCFELNDPKKSKNYSCTNCKLKMDRDVNASKNIYIKVIANKMETAMKK